MQKEFIVPNEPYAISHLHDLFETPEEFEIFELRFRSFISREYHLDNIDRTIEVSYEIDSDSFRFRVRYRDLAKINWTVALLEHAYHNSYYPNKGWYLSSIIVDLLGHGIVLSQDQLDSEYSEIYVSVPLSLPHLTPTSGSLTEIASLEGMGCGHSSMRSIEKLFTLTASDFESVDATPSWVYNEVLRNLTMHNFREHDRPVKITYDPEIDNYIFSKAD